jgi:hypothetical protein
MNLSELRRQFNLARTRNLSLKEWFVSQDEYDDLLEELKEFCTTRTYIENDGDKGMAILGVKIKIRD